MKKGIAIILLVALTAMLLVACAPQKTADKKGSDDSSIKDMDVNPDISKVVTPSESKDNGPKIDDSYNVKKGEPALREAPYEPATPEPEPEIVKEPEAEPKKLPVTKEELDTLKTDIEGISTEDLGGLEE